MKHINKILLVFISVICLFVVVAWKVIQTEAFSDILSSQFVMKIEKKFDLQISFSRLEVELFPPATILKDLKIEKKTDNEDKNFKIMSHEIGLYFSYSSFFSNKIAVKKIKISDGIIYTGMKKEALNDKKNESYFSEKKRVRFFKLYNNYIKSRLFMGIKEIELENVKMNFKNYEANMRESFIDLKESSIYTKMKLESIKGNDKADLNDDIDSIEMEGALTKNRVSLKSFKVKKGFDSIVFSGVFDFNKKEINDGSIHASGFFEKYIEKYLPKRFSPFSGYFTFEGDLQGELSNLNSNYRLRVLDLASPYSDLDELEIAGRKKSSHFFIDSLIAKTKGGNLKIKESHGIYNIDEGLLSANKIKINISKVRAQDMFSSFDFLQGMRGQLSGDILLTIRGGEKKSEKNYEEIIIETKNVEVKDFNLLSLGKNKISLLKNQGFHLKKSLFRINKSNNVFIDANVEMENTLLNVKGIANSDEIDLICEGGLVDLQDIGPIVSVEVLGKGPIDFKVKGPLQNVIFTLHPRLERFKLLNLNFGKINSSFDFSFSNLSLKIKKFMGQYNETKYYGDGDIDFKKEGELDLNLDFPMAVFKDSFQMYHHYIKELDINHKILKGTYSSSYHISGPLSLDGLKIKGKFKAKNLDFYSEEIDTASGLFQLKNKNIFIENIKLKKGIGIFHGNYQYNLDNGFFEYDGSLKKLELNSVNLYQRYGAYYNGNIFATFYGSGTKDDYSLKSQFEVVDANINNIPVKNASLTLFQSSDELYLTAQFLGNEFILDSYFNLKDKKISFIKGWANTKKLNVLASLFSEHNIDDETISGDIIGSLKFNFFLENIEKGDFNIELKKMSLKKGDFRLNGIKGRNKIEIMKGHIKKWDMALKGEKNHIYSIGEGALFDGFLVKNGFDFGAEIVELLSPRIRNTVGRFRSNVDFKKEKGRYLLSGRGYADDISFYALDIKKKIESLNAEFYLKDEMLILNRFDGHIGNGNFKIMGGAKLTLPFPEADFSLELENAEFSILDQSLIVVSGLGHLRGKKMPYLFKGNYSVIHGDIRDELKSFMGQKNKEHLQSRFIPDQKSGLINGPLNFDIKINIFRPIIAKNLLMDMSFDGDLAIKGTPQNPLFNGQLMSIPGRSTFLFKGHEFIITEGSINFRDLKHKTSPLIRFSGVSQINEYDIKVSVLGPTNKLKFELSAVPSLSYEDILSLLTLGVTSEISKNLEDDALQSITSIGVGSLLLDQFKVNQGLNKSLGLRLSVSPEFETNSSSLIKGREGVAAPETLKLRSTTRIKLQRKIKKNIEMSVSSTVGGGGTQKQEMNINYNVNKNISIQGVYEVKSTEENETNSNPDSVGADINFRWSFK